jgi:hypothetical protein
MKRNEIQFFIPIPAGEVYQRSANTYYKWEKLGQACGTLVIPESCKIRLSLIDATAAQVQGIYTTAPDQVCEIILGCAKIQDTEIASLLKFELINGLALWETDITDESLKYIEKLSSLEWLDVGDTKITDRGLAYLASMNFLRELVLLNTSVGDFGLEHLTHLRSIEHLNLMGTKITDKCVTILARYKSIRFLRIYDTHITQEGFLKLRESLPDCEIEYNL